MGSVLKSSDVIFSCLPSAAALTDVVDRVAQSKVRPRAFVDVSTLALADKEAARLKLELVGVPMLDCPVSGTPSQARSGDLVVLGSGDGSLFEEVRGILQNMSTRQIYFGPFGEASKAKLVVNLLVAVHTAVAGEAFALARKAGLDVKLMLDVINNGAGSSKSLEVRGESWRRRGDGLNVPPYDR